MMKKSQEFAGFVGLQKWTSTATGPRNVSVDFKYDVLCSSVFEGYTQLESGEAKA